ncbi:MAG TPA: hypothetical protein VGD78_15920 [Chthoniobacterales bacterium]
MPQAARRRCILQVMINPRLQVAGVPFSGCSAFVKVEQEGAAEAFGFRSAHGVAWRFAENVVQWAALRAVDAPHGHGPAGSALLLDALPDELRCATLCMGRVPVRPL